MHRIQRSSDCLSVERIQTLTERLLEDVDVAIHWGLSSRPWADRKMVALNWIIERLPLGYVALCRFKAVEKSLILCLSAKNILRRFAKDGDLRVGGKVEHKKLFPFWWPFGKVNSTSEGPPFLRTVYCLQYSDSFYIFGAVPHFIPRQRKGSDLFIGCSPKKSAKVSYKDKHWNFWNFISFCRWAHRRYHSLWG